MKALVCGSRDWTNRDLIADRLHRLHYFDDESVTVIVGAAKGADALAAEIAAWFGFDIHLHQADWNRYGRRAGPIRNRLMLDEEPDLVIAFQRNGSRGTQHTIDEARKRGIPVEVHTA